METSFTFNNNNSRELFRIESDGTIKFGEAFTTQDEASLAFWEAIEVMRPPKQQELTEERAVEIMAEAIYGTEMHGSWCWEYQRDASRRAPYYKKAKAAYRAIKAARKGE